MLEDKFSEGKTHGAGFGLGRVPIAANDIQTGANAHQTLAECHSFDQQIVQERVRLQRKERAYRSLGVRINQ